MPAAANDPVERGGSRAARWLLAPPSCGVPEGTPRRSSLRFPLSLPGSFASLATITPGRLLGRRAADAPCRLLIGILDAAEVAPEAILVELLARPLVPEAAGVGADLVGEQDLAVMAAELELHVDQHDVALVEVLAQDGVHAQRRLVDGGELVRRGQAEVADVPVVDHRVVERVVLVEVLEDGLGERLALRAPEALGEAPGDDVARHHLDLHDLAAADQHVALGEAAHEVGRHALLLEEAEEDLGHAVVEDALVDDRAALLRVEGGGVVLEVLDEEVGIGSGVELLRLALVEQLTAIHRRPPRRARRGPGYAAGGAPCQRGWRAPAASGGAPRRGRPPAASGSLRPPACSAAPSGRPRRASPRGARARAAPARRRSRRPAARGSRASPRAAPRAPRSRPPGARA